ncbi:MAG: 4Fe-4S binding protein [Betaproteobacteria bacterium]|nr:4Fe-4S binding protein [Betaproteobacteria bacterium]
MSLESSPVGNPAEPGDTWENFAEGVQFQAGRCVHAHSPIASCHACESMCPRRAWKLDEDGLDFDPDACDGCGLCIPACPEAAIRSEPAPEPLPVGEKVWLLACTHAGVEHPNLPCLHALRDDEVLAQWHRGCREILCAAVECARCPRAPEASRRLPARLERINQALRQRQLQPIAQTSEPAAAWNRRERRQREARPDLARRAWLSRVVAAPVVAPETKLPPGKAAPVSWPWLARIDPARCTACDACMRLCAHQALRRKEDCYLSEPRNCTGCGLCVDVCAEHAVSLEAWGCASDVLRWPVYRKNCAHCQAPFHSCVDDAQSYCRICRQVRHPRADLRIFE